MEDCDVVVYDIPNLVNGLEFEVELLSPWDWDTSARAFKNGGWCGTGISRSSPFVVKNSTTSSIDGLRVADACVHKSPICKTSNASCSGKSPWSNGSIASATTPSLYSFQTYTINKLVGLTRCWLLSKKSWKIDRFSSLNSLQKWTRFFYESVVSFPACDFENYDSETKNICLFCKLTSNDVFRCHIASENNAKITLFTFWIVISSTIVYI